MSNYELTLVLPGDISLAKRKTFLDRLEKFVKQAGGKIINSKEWGKIDLAYKIKKESSGFFLLLNLSLEKDSVKKLKDKLRLEDDIIRYLIVREEEV